MTLSRVRIEDLETIVTIENEIFKQPWAYKDFLYELEENPFVHFYALKNDTDEVIGYIDFWITFDTVQIATIGITKKAQGNGHANTLMQKCIDEAQAQVCHNITLEVRVSNKVAIQLYRSFGFVPVVIKQGYYKDGEDALLMMRML